MNLRLKPNRSGWVPRLLVVDEVGPVREAMSLLLRREGYDVEVAADGDEAMQLLELVRWDAVVLDIDRPGMNGIELYARIVRVYGTVRLPVVFLSAQPNAHLHFGLHAAPWARLVQKPCAFLQLLEALQQCFRSLGCIGSA